MEKMPIHINAKKGKIAKTVLMPGDPLRAKMIAENFLEDAKKVTDTRAMYGFTGKYKGEEITVMGSGMGMPSMGIYAYELFEYYDVENIIRIGSCGSIDEEFGLRNVGLVNLAYNSGEFARVLTGEENHVSYPSEEINKKILDMYEELEYKFPLKNVNICTSECFNEYVINPEKLIEDMPEDLSIKGFEMEAFALFETAKRFNKNAACLLTVVDASYTDERLTSEERQEDLVNMIRLALETAKTL